MAKRHRKHRRKHYGFGSIISVRKGFDGLFDAGTVVGDALPIVIGSGIALGTVFAFRKLAGHSANSAMQFLSRNAYLVSMGAGALVGLGLVYGMGRRTAGTAVIASSVATSGALMLNEKFGGVAGIGGFGAIVPQFGAVMPEMAGLGATVLEQWPQGQRPDSIGQLGAAYGPEVNLSGLGAVNTTAFGTPGFNA